MIQKDNKNPLSSGFFIYTTLLCHFFYLYLNMETSYFINKAKLVHGDRYDYSLVNYVNSNTKVNIICVEHGIFEQQPRAHLAGQNCPNCNKYNTKTLIEKLKKTHGDKYDYSLVEYKTIKDIIKIICPIHGEFKQRPTNHIQGHGCLKCSTFSTIKKLKKDVRVFINESNLKHKNKYDYSLVDYINNRCKVKIICPIHGEFKQRPDSHLSGSGCPICNESKCEKEIGEFLIENKINFIKEKKIH